MLISPQEAAMVDEHLAPARAAVTPQEWQAALAAGRALSQSEALALLRPDIPWRAPAAPRGSDR